MSKVQFYKDKLVAQTEWWLHSCDLPELRWGSLRVFNDGTADSCFEEGGKLYRFENRSYASYILSEDEYVRFETLGKDDEKEYGIQLAGITLPEWQVNQEQEFEYLGIY
ncbi:MAG TPA: hypothetical protein VK651_04510 [Blastocatellia bacterium]|nr:hypothetical protein [Blastocatellia bacterium]